MLCVQTRTNPERCPFPWRFIQDHVTTPQRKGISETRETSWANGVDTSMTIGRLGCDAKCTSGHRTISDWPYSFECQRSRSRTEFQIPTPDQTVVPYNRGLFLYFWIYQAPYSSISPSQKLMIIVIKIGHLMVAKKTPFRVIKQVVLLGLVIQSLHWNFTYWNFSSGHHTKHGYSPISRISK